MNRSMEIKKLDFEFNQKILHYNYDNQFEEIDS